MLQDYIEQFLHYCQVTNFPAPQSTEKSLPSEALRILIASRRLIMKMPHRNL